ncbi:hypothetical protein HK101_004784 [Irineochytrium annulatum]|nr:hypothetical protein HK101_004784 [Irineochytrium annulatum]
MGTPSPPVRDRDVEDLPSESHASDKSDEALEIVRFVEHLNHEEEISTALLIQAAREDEELENGALSVTEGEEDDSIRPGDMYNEAMDAIEFGRGLKSRIVAMMGLYNQLVENMRERLSDRGG